MMHYSITAQPDYLLVTECGDWVHPEIEALIDLVPERAAEAGKNRVLVDITGLKPPVDDMNRYYVGRRIAEAWHSLRAAIVWKTEHIIGFGENTAVNRGAVLKVFTDHDEARRWLLER